MTNVDGNKKKPKMSLAKAGSLALLTLFGGYFLSENMVHSKATNIPIYSSLFTKRLNDKEAVKIKGIEKIISSNGDSPDIIFMPQRHPLMDISKVRSTVDFADFLNSLEGICNQLHDKYNVKSILLEGYPEWVAREYNKNGQFRFDYSKINLDQAQFWQGYENIINGREWNLYAAESKETVAAKDIEEQEIVQFMEKFNMKVNKECEKFLNEEIYSKEKGSRKIDMTKYNDVIHNIFTKAIKDLSPAAYEEFDRMMTPEKMDNLYSVVFNKRNDYVLEQCMKCIDEKKSPIIVVYGSKHTEALLNEMKERNLKYLAVLPEHSKEEYSCSKEDLKEFYKISTFPGGNSKTKFRIMLTENGFVVTK